MSQVTDLVFITPNADWVDDESRCLRFEASFLAAHGREIVAAQGQGKAMSTAVYVAGVNWIKPKWIEAVVADDWPEGTVLWLDIEGLMDQPNERIVHQLGPKAGRS
jgi:hypothetical protein